MKKLAVCCVLFLSLFLTGCWDKIELSEVYLVSAVGVDTTDNDGVRVTVEALEIESQDQAGKPTGIYFSSEGETVSDAVENMYHSTEKMLFWAHNQAVIIGEDAAKESLQKYLNHFSMENDMSTDTYLLVAKGKASDLLEEKVEKGASIGMMVSDILSPQGRRGNSVVVPVTLLDHAREMLTEGLDTMIPLVYLVERGEGNDQQPPKLDEFSGEKEEAMPTVSGNLTEAGNKKGENAGSDQKSKEEVCITGMAVIKGDKMIGEIDQQQTDGAIWLHDDVRGGIIIIPGLDERGKIGLEIISSKSRIDIEPESDGVKATINVEVETGVSEQVDSTDLTQPGKIAQLERLLNQTIAGQIEGVLDQAAEYQCDILGIGEACHRKKPKLWQKYKDAAYPYGFDIHVQIDSHIVSLGNIKPTHAIKSEGSDLVVPKQ